MSENNGYHPNGHGGQGAAASEPIIDPHHRRRSYQMLERAIDVATDIPYDAMKAAAHTAIKDLGDKDGRIRARAREFLLKLQDSGVGAAIGLDKIERLDGGQDTHRASITVNYISKEASRIADDYD